MAPRKTKKEQAAHQKAALQEEAAAQGSKAMEPDVSLQGDEEESTSRLLACELTTDKEEGSTQSNKDSKRKSTPPNIQATKRPKKLLVSSENSKQRRMVGSCKEPKGKTGYRQFNRKWKGESDEDKDNQKQYARTSPTIESNR